MVVDPAGGPRFFVGAVVALAIGLGGADGLAISGAVSIEADVAVGFSGLSLW